MTNKTNEQTKQTIIEIARLVYGLDFDSFLATLEPESNDWFALSLNLLALDLAQLRKSSALRALALMPEFQKLDDSDRDWAADVARDEK